MADLHFIFFALPCLVLGIRSVNKGQEQNVQVEVMQTQGVLLLSNHSINGSELGPSSGVRSQQLPHNLVSFLNATDGSRASESNSSTSATYGSRAPQSMCQRFLTDDMFCRIFCQRNVVCDYLNKQQVVPQVSQKQRSYSGLAGNTQGANPLIVKADKRDYAAKIFTDSASAMREFVRQSLIPGPHIVVADDLLSFVPPKKSSMMSMGRSSQPPPKYAMIMEHMAGGTLRNYIYEKELTEENIMQHEEEVKSLASQLVDGLQAIHARGLAHLNIHMDSVLLDGARQKAKWTDFSHSMIESSNDKAPRVARNALITYGFSAPEMSKLTNQCYSFASDVWSLGALFYAMHYRRPPFGQDSLSAIKKAATNRDFHSKEHASQEFIDLVDDMTQVDPCQRPSLQEVKKHKWFTGLSQPHIEKQDMEAVVDLQTCIGYCLNKVTSEKTVVGQPQHRIEESESLQQAPDPPVSRSWNTVTY